MRWFGIVSSLITVAFGAGYVLALKVGTNRPMSWIWKRGIARTFQDKEGTEFYDLIAREDREVFAFCVVQSLYDLGGRFPHQPVSREAWRGVFKLADHRMKQTWKKGRQSPVHGETS